MTESEVLGPGGGDEHGVTPEGRPAVVLTDQTPAVLQHSHPPVSLRHHRLDGEDHARLQPPEDLVGAVVDIRRPHQKLSNAVAGYLSDHGAVVRSGVFADGAANTGDEAAGLTDGQSDICTLSSNSDQLLGVRVDLADSEGVGRAAVVAREKERQLDTEDIAGLKRSPVRNAPAYHVVHRAVDTLGKTSVVEEGGVSFMDHNQLSRKLVQLLSGHPGLD